MDLLLTFLGLNCLVDIELTKVIQIVDKVLRYLDGLFGVQKRFLMSV